MITYVMPVVALFLGVALLGEPLTIGAAAGLVLIAAGAWLATRRRAPGAGADPGGRHSDGQDRDDDRSPPEALTLEEPPRPRP